MNRLHPDTREEAAGLSERLNGLFRKAMVLIPLGIIANLGWCLWTTDHQAVGSLLHVHPGYLGAAALCSVIPWLTGSLRMFVWTRFLKQPVRYRDALSIAVTADLGAAIAPPLIGGGAVKIGMLMNRGLDAGTALSLPVLENLEDAVFFLFIITVACAAATVPDLSAVLGKASLPGSAHVAAGFIGALVGGLLLAACLALIVPKCTHGIRAAARTFIRTFQLIGGKGKRVLALTLLLTAIQWTCRYSIISLLAAGLGLPVAPALFMALQVLVFALTILVPSPGGIGGAEVFFSLAYAPFLPAAALGLVTTLWRFFTFYLHSLLAAASVLVLAWINRDTDIAGTGDSLPAFRPKEELSLAQE